MARRLILLDPSRLDGVTPIEPGYPRDYTAQDMRTWAADLERYFRTPAADLARWRAAPPETLAPEQRGVVRAYDAYFVAPERGIKGSLREDGKVELDGGRHRAAYLTERGTPIPVWVSARDERQLDALSSRRAARERERNEERGDRRD